MNKRAYLLKSMCLYGGFFLLFLFFQVTTLYGGDAGDLISAAYTRGIAHPPGYPLYSFLGYILSQISFSTVAWRLALLSSLPSAGTATITYLLVKAFTNSKLSALLSSTILSTTYVFWLYAIVPEVFALNTFFVALMLYVSYMYSLSPSLKKLYVLALLAGLSLTHHHTVIFAFPAYLVLILQKPQFLRSIRPMHIGKLAACFVGGLLPYSWVYISALSNPPILWDDPITLKNFVRLVSRADYGSFQSGIKYAQNIQSRFLQFPALYNFYIEDFKVFGMLLFAVGAITSWFKQRNLFVPIFLGFLFTGPLFYFYASYLYTSDFLIATAERFLLLSYFFISLFIGIGISSIHNHIQSIKSAYISRTKRLIIVGFLAICILLPLSLFIQNYPKLSILKYDRTAEKFGRDILMTTEPQSILFLQGDHPVFNTQYMYYINQVRQDVMPIHTSKLLNGTLYRQLDKYFPHLTITKSKDTLKAIYPFIQTHYPIYPIYSTVPFDLIPKGYTWLPYGLLYKLYKDEDIPNYSRVALDNDLIWSTYQDPLDGSLGSFNNLMLSNVVEYYSDASVRRGLYAFVHGEDYTDALRYYDYALRLDPQSGSIMYLKGDAYIALKDCNNAQKAFKLGYSLRPRETYVYYDSMNSLYTRCMNDPKKAAYWAKKRDSLMKKKETQLEEL